MPTWVAIEPQIRTSRQKEVDPCNEPWVPVPVAFIYRLTSHVEVLRNAIWAVVVRFWTLATVARRLSPARGQDRLTA